ncbi:GDPD-domain-containing protein [Eremomyces bilateralis CBS 781.70]|uniref:GDPD-domain-containing protein n=1 Tax=Eremomyces bilateralis CBS 781.70 TaxID=1392243 RepID=A0A6G1FXE8_9PEZI|nr:GDPD-domain-containing protein [Eremomyces bilateralis CBS 781.70]KAF1810351.1 GDPD-domain-containing protein [Eremomyces bilateralis CBS 781.70]
MKFGHNLPRNQVPEWASYYINYKGLKKHIKALAQETSSSGQVDLTEFLFSLDRNLEDVDGFYNRKYAKYTRRLKRLEDTYEKLPRDALDKDEAEELVRALLELRCQLRKLQWYGEVNRRGFIKITKKLDKKVPNAGTQPSYIASKVDPKPFASNTSLNTNMNALNEWLSALSGSKAGGETSSTMSSGSARTVSSRAISNLPSALLDSVDQAVRNDDATTLVELLQEASVGDDVGSADDPRLLLNLLQRSITNRSMDCITRLLERTKSLDEDEDINKRNCIHRLIIGIGRSANRPSPQNDEPGAPTLGAGLITPAEMPILRRTKSGGPEKDKLDDDSFKLLVFLLDGLSATQHSAILAKDASGRTPLHYAAEQGTVQVCRELLDRMLAWNLVNNGQDFEADAWLDDDGFAPLHLSIINGNPLTGKLLVEARYGSGSQTTVESTQTSRHNTATALALAVKANHVSTIKILVEAGLDLNVRNGNGETILHECARCGRDECLKVLLEGTGPKKLDLEATENTFGWTPLFVACVDGHLGAVQALADAGAELTRTDISGWTAQEHAALRGHINIAELLSELIPSSASVPGTFTGTVSSKEDGLSTPLAPGLSMLQQPTSAIKTFGHRYLRNQPIVLLSLGSLDMRKAIEPVKLDEISIREAHTTQLDTALSIVVSALGAEGEPVVIDLPVQENVATDPIAFITSDLSKVKILFDIIPTYSGSKERVLGRGVAMLEAVKPSIGSKRMSLQGDLSVPIIAAPTLNVIGQVNFNFLVVTPFSHPNMSITEGHTYWKTLTAPMVIGHRGLGKNIAARKSLQLGENTIESFVAAANLGASYVEFDVQLTKDHIPIIYHDFLVSETGIDAPVHTLTLEQFLHVNGGQSQRESRPPNPRQSRNDSAGSNGARSTWKPRSFSVGSVIEDGVLMNERMKHTKDFKAQGFKGNTRGNFIQAPFTTLEEMFQRLPENVGFNIEMKYPMLLESEAHDMDTYGVELNSFVDTVLKKVYELSGGRNIIFSSFHPDICILLSLKQPSIPVLFLTDAGTSPVSDVRASSLQEAIRFAVRWNLLGIVTSARPLVMCPRLVKVVKESGLVCVTYGSLNNDPENVKAQVQHGIDAVIVDSVLAIRNGLTESESTES